MKLFESGKIGKLSIKNRIVMSAIAVGALTEPEGGFSQRVIDYYVARAKGGAGLIITGVAFVSCEIEDLPIVSKLVVDSKICMSPLSELVDAIHDYGAKVAVQLTAGFGRNTDTKLPVAPSALPCSLDPNVIARLIKSINHHRL